MKLAKLGAIALASLLAAAAAGTGTLYAQDGAEKKAKPSKSAGGKSSGGPAAKCKGQYMYYDTATKQCLDARDKKK